MIAAEIEDMTAAERLRMMESLWDAICHDAAEPDSPSWHEDVLSERHKKIKSGEAIFLSLEETKRRLQG
ncbi:MAG: addiction module protein [Verrucomicrobia bacterium]|nr:addiction module protein [Verrucomicrobiota bacterium]